MKKLRLAFVCVVLLLLVACGKTAVDSWQEQYDLGMHYLLEGNYEEAILAFSLAIEIDPMQEDTYLQLAQVYIEQGAYAEAETFLEKALQQIQGGDIEALLSNVRELKAGGGHILTIHNETPEYGTLRVYRSVQTESWPVMKGEEILSGGVIPYDKDYVIFEVEGIADGYRISSLKWNGEEQGDSLIYGGYGSFATHITENTELIFTMEEIPDTLPTVPKVSIYDGYMLEDRSLFAELDDSGFSKEYIDYIWEYREKNGNKWEEIWFWRGGHSCRVEPYAGQEIDLRGKYVRVTAQGRQHYAEGSSVSEEYFVQ